MTYELNIDGLVGPTHNYAGLSHGNIASDNNRGLRSNPQAAVLQGLKKMETLMSLGVPQAVMPPQERPFIPFLRDIGYSGSDVTVIQNAWQSDPALVVNLSSASAMWTANAATIASKVDATDALTHLTPANLRAMPHRSVEPQSTRRLLKTLFRDSTRFCVHDPLPSNNLFGDEGAANHNRLAANHGSYGLNIFVHGQTALQSTERTTRYPARQSLEACQAISRLHNLPDDRVIHVRQNPIAIDAGAFHNDVVCVANETVLLLHEHAFYDQPTTLDRIRAQANNLGFDPKIIIADQQELSLENAVRSYIFNSQLVTLPSGGMALILPADAEENDQARQFAQRCLEDNNPIRKLHYLDLRQSMRNGGGPACLRLRIPLNKDDLGAMHQPVLLNKSLLEKLRTWANKHYRDRLDPADLGDPSLIIECQTALDELTQILEIGSFYHFQHKDYDQWDALH